MIELDLVGEYGLLGAFIAGMLFLYRIRNNDLQHITEHLEELQENTKKVLEELVRVRILLESERKRSE
ncbi:MAG: hypothetical protein QXM92_04005 [Candidatus Anstonellales archaeon]